MVVVVVLFSLQARGLSSRYSRRVVRLTAKGDDCCSSRACVISVCDFKGFKLRQKVVSQVLTV